MSGQSVGKPQSSGIRVRQNGSNPAQATAQPAWRRYLPLVALLAGAAAFFALGGHRYLTWEALRDNHAMLQDWVAAHAVLAALVFFGVYIVCTALSLPFGSLLTLAGGFLFGIVPASLIVVVAATLGAAIVFLAARSAVGDALRARAGGFLARMEQGFRDNAFSYLLFLRLVPVFPFWLVNIVPALVGMRLAPYVLATLIGILPGTVVFASVGNGLGHLFESGGTPDFAILLEPQILLPMLALAALSLAPVLYRRWKGRSR
ncbi:MAG: TVP38/TMEM64 family protein [Reyranellaceae bacterium]